MDRKKARIVVAACLLAGLAACAGGGGPVIQDGSGNPVRIGGIEAGTDPLGDDNASGGASRGRWPEPSVGQGGW